jgi:hypothetical protein
MELSRPVRPVLAKEEAMHDENERKILQELTTIRWLLIAIATMLGLAGLAALAMML